jgi:hypothetical protein
MVLEQLATDIRKYSPVPVTLQRRAPAAVEASRPARIVTGGDGGRPPPEKEANAGQALVEGRRNVTSRKSG